MIIWYNLWYLCCALKFAFSGRKSRSQRKTVFFTSFKYQSEDRHDGSPCRTRMGHSEVTIAARSEAARPSVVYCSDWRLVFSFLFLKRTLSRSWNRASYEVGALCSPLTVWTAWFLLTPLITKLLSTLKTTFISHDFTCFPITSCHFHHFSSDKVDKHAKVKK